MNKFYFYFMHEHFKRDQDIPTSEFCQIYLKTVFRQVGGPKESLVYKHG